MRRRSRDFVQLGARLPSLPLSARRRARLRIERVWHRATAGRLEGRLSPDSLSGSCLVLEAADEHWAQAAVTMLDGLVQDLRKADPSLEVRSVRVRYAGRVVSERAFEAPRDREPADDGSDAPGG